MAAIRPETRSIMEKDVSVIKRGGDPFPPVPSSARLAILLPTARWTPMARSVIGSMIGVASEEVAVLIADNSEDTEKQEFLAKIRSANPHVIAVTHEKNIGASANFNYLFEWSRPVEFIAMMADDDWMSPAYHVDAYKQLLDRPDASSAEVGITLLNLGDGKFRIGSQPSIRGSSPIERIRQWNGLAGRATMYNASRRAAVEAACEFLDLTPLQGWSLAEDIWELSRLASGNFLNIPGQNCFVHYAAHCSPGQEIQQQYELCCKGAGLQLPFAYFLGLSTAIQCGLFLMGNRSPISDPLEKERCGQYVFGNLFKGMFLPRFAGEAGPELVTDLFKDYPAAMTGFSQYYAPSFAREPLLDRPFIDWFVEVIKVFETRPPANGAPLSERFRKFVDLIFT